VYNRRNRNDEKGFKFITRATKAVLLRRWEEQGKNSALVHLFELAVNRLPDDEFPEKFNKSWQWMAKVLCGYVPKNELPGLQEQIYSYDSRHAYVMQQYDSALHITSNQSTFKRNMIWPITATLLSILKELEQEGSKEATNYDRNDEEPVSAVSWSESSAVNPYYVTRPDFHRRFNQLVKEPDTTVVAFVGFPGMGKTWLATALARLDDGSQAPVVRVVSGKISVPDLQSACHRFGVEIGKAISSDPSAYLTLLLCEASAPKFVILDNLESTDELRHLLPRDGTKSIVVATARNRGDLVRAGWKFVDVGKMDDEEAVGLVARQAPQLSHDDALMLVSSLAGYPLAISNACGLFVEQGCPVSDFCSDLKTDAGISLGV
jgi:hypothetical protein